MEGVVMPITVKDLPDLIGNDQHPVPFLYCDLCGEHNSADAGDYWDVPADQVFTCCEVEMRLVVEVCHIEDWKKPEKP
jgi:hypothetical protein